MGDMVLPALRAHHGASTSVVRGKMSSKHAIAVI